MASNVYLPQRQRSADGKSWVPTGQKEEFTEYVFLDSQNDKIVLVARDVQYRSLIQKSGTLTVAVEYNSYDRKWKVSLHSFVVIPVKVPAKS